MTGRLPPWRLVAGAAALALAGCASAPPTPSAEPDKVLQQAAVAAQLPVAAGAPAVTVPYGWRDVVRQPRLAQLVELALQGNRDFRTVVLNVQRAQAQLNLADANRLPSLGVVLNASRLPNSKGEEVNQLLGGVQLAAWEVDLFGRLASLSEAARAQLLASEAGQRAAELALAATVVQAALALQADDELLVLARQSLDSREQSLKLAQLREAVGAASLLELQAQQSLAFQARATLAQLTRQRAQDANTLALLLGQPVPPALLSSAGGPPLESEDWLTEVPAGLSSTVLLRRPDVIAAEQQMRSAQANIAAARAAFWPVITLTASAGQASAQLSGLFQGGNFAYTLAANALLTVFDGGRRDANLAAAETAQQVAQAQYERAIQAAFRDAADGLAGLATWREQLLAQQAAREAARSTARLIALKADQGAASVLEQLEAERALWLNEQAVVQVRLAELNNRVLLFKALGG
ncbi:MAG: efflux transporter outer membrane subunit [Burkholderiaceae bacterium]|nr:efflux transporter outer membrane subunit [Burkholderiaceae bacterium]